MISALGEKGAPGIVTLATIDIVFIALNLSSPPTLEIYFSNIDATVTYELISFLKIGLSISSLYLLNYFTGINLFL